MVRVAVPIVLLKIARTREIGIEMVILLNGSFGVGKSTVAEILQTKLPGSRVYDPEIVGSILMRLPKWVNLKGRFTDDFQDIELWRKSVSAGIRYTQRMYRGAVIVPMTFDRHDYLNQISDAVRHFDLDLHIFCLCASLETIHQRIGKRGDLDGPGAEWIKRRSAECVSAHQNSGFGMPIDTENRSSQAVAEEILACIRKNEPKSDTLPPVPPTYQL